MHQHFDYICCPVYISSGTDFCPLFSVLLVCVCECAYSIIRKCFSIYSTTSSEVLFCFSLLARISFSLEPDTKLRTKDRKNQQTINEMKTKKNTSRRQNIYSNTCTISRSHRIERNSRAKKSWQQPTICWKKSHIIMFPLAVQVCKCVCVRKSVGW